MPVGDFVPSLLHLDYPEWAAPLIGNIGQVWAYNGTGYVPTALNFDPAGTAAAAVATHVALSNPHSQYYLASGVSGFGATLIDDANAATARTTLGLGTAAVLNVGTGANNVVQLDGSSRLPAVDGSQLTGITVAAAGSNTQVIYNASGVYAGDAGLTYNASTDRLTVTGGLVAPSMRPSSDSTSALQLQNAAGTSVVTVDTTNRRLDLSSTQALSTTNYLQTWVNNSVTRSRIDSRGAQYWYLSNTVAEVGAIEYGTPGGLPGIIFRNGASYNLNRVNFFYDTATSFALSFDADYISPYYGGLKISAGGGVEGNVIGSNTTTITNALTLRYVSSGTPEAGHGVGVIAALKSSTTQNNSVGRLTWEWNRADANSAAHGTRSARMRLTGNYTSTERVFIDAIAVSSAPLIGFLGATPVARQVVPTGSSNDDIITALQNLGLFSQT